MENSRGSEAAKLLLVVVCVARFTPFLSEAAKQDSLDNNTVNNYNYFLVAAAGRASHIDVQPTPTPAIDRPTPYVTRRDGKFVHSA